MSITRRLISTGRYAGGLLASTIGLGLLSGLIVIALSRLLSRIVTAAFLDASSVDNLYLHFVFCLGLLALRAIVSWAGEFISHQAALRIKKSIRTDLLKHMFHIGPSLIWQADDQEGRTGELVNTSMQGVEALEAFFSQYLPQLALSTLVPLSILIFLFPLDPLTGIVLLLTAPLLPLFMYLLGSAAKIQTRRQWQGLSRMSAYFLEVLQGLTTLKALGCSSEQTKIIDNMSESYRQVTMSVLRVTFLSALALEMLSTLSTAVVAVEVGLRLLNGRLNFEPAFFILLLAPEFYLPLRLLGLRFHPAMAGIEAARRIFEILDISPGFNPSVDTQSIEKPELSLSNPPKIRLNDVSFTYANNREGLIEANIEIPAHQTTILVGVSGAGKSTLLSLLLRFIQPQSGSILVNDIPLCEIPYSSWIHNLAWVPQNPYLFKDSLAANISLSRPGASLEQIQAAARLAHADEFIQSFPEKYATQIGERGVRLSAGQAQRIALARAFLQDAPLLILDEPDAHLDPHTDSLLLDSLTELIHNRTVLIVSHKINSRLPADQIIRLDQGRVQQIDRTSNFQSALKQRINANEHSYKLDSSDQVAIPISNSSSSSGLSKTIKKPSLLRLLGLLYPFSGRVAISVFLGFLTVASSMGLMSTAAYLISSAALRPSISELQVVIVGVRFFGLSRGVFRYLERLALHDVTFRLLGSLRGWFYRAVEPLVPARTQHLHSGDLLQRAIGDIASLEDFYVRGIAPPFVAILTGLAACLMIANFSTTMALYLAILLFFAGVAFPLLILALNSLTGRELTQRQTKLNNALVDSIQGMPDLIATGQSSRQLNFVLETASLLGQTQSRVAFLSGFQSSVSRLAADLGMLGILWLGIKQINIGQLDGVALGALGLLAFSCFEAFLPLPQAAQHLSTCLAAADRLYEIADSKPEVAEPVDPVPLASDINLKITDLSFSYPDQTSIAGKEVFNSVSLLLTPGQKVALVGASGAGKSTLINIILHFWKCPVGTIFINERDFNSYSGDELRKKIAFLPQNPFLFSGTILDNIRLAYPQAPPPDIEKAIHMVYLNSWIESLPDGYHTWIGEGGVKVSGGQRQRIALARTLLRPSMLYILDEPTAYIDPETENIVLNNILRIDSSVLIVTHHVLETLHFDNILLLENGRIINLD